MLFIRFENPVYISRDFFVSTCDFSLNHYYLSSPIKSFVLLAVTDFELFFLSLLFVDGTYVSRCFFTGSVDLIFVSIAHLFHRGKKE